MNTQLSFEIMSNVDFGTIMVEALSMGGPLDNVTAHYEYEDMMMRAIYASRNS
jgi:hypothetical protein